jgi:hypothetical protein
MWSSRWVRVSLAAAKYKVHDIVEDIAKGDLPFMVLAVQDYGHIPRYSIESITGERIENFPEYLLRPARPPHESEWGSK